MSHVNGGKATSPLFQWDASLFVERGASASAPCSLAARQTLLQHLQQGNTFRWGAWTSAPWKAIITAKDTRKQNKKQQTKTVGRFNCWLGFPWGESCLHPWKNLPSNYFLLVRGLHTELMTSSLSRLSDCIHFLMESNPYSMCPWPCSVDFSSSWFLWTALLGPADASARTDLPPRVSPGPCPWLCCACSEVPAPRGSLLCTAVPFLLLFKHPFDQWSLHSPLPSLHTHTFLSSPSFFLPHLLLSSSLPPWWLIHLHLRRRLFRAARTPFWRWADLLFRIIV